MSRERLPDRRPSETVTFDHDGTSYASLLLQHGVEPPALAKTMGRLGDGKAPASVIGAIVDLLDERQTAEPAAHGEAEERN